MAARAAIPVFRSPMWPWVLVSGIVHLIVVLVGFLFGNAAGMLIPGRGVADGDGFGGNSIELELEGPQDRPRVGSLAPQSAAPQVTPSPPVEDPGEPTEVADAVEVEAPPEPAEAEEGTPVVERPEPRPRPPPSPAPSAARSGQSEVESQGAPDSVAATAPGEGEDSGGTGADDSTAGVPAGDPAALILGSAGVGGSTVSARQALLPNGGVCEDPAVGTWRAQKFRASDRSWVRFTLRIQRSGSGIEGTITSRIWSGRAADPRPGPCTAFGSDHTWRMDARGSLRGDRMTFASRNARLIAEHCPRGGNHYAPDRFSGTLHPLREVFAATNNDGAYDIDEPYTFRRTSCDP